ncbi:MAG: phosphoadenosine phosphosulfate reductase [Ignavibacteria bacterium GWB2_36_8]|nr:MAG: phosphoadenosine phosphosulfate reductase [Ignavibacteria bacterium GWB2_36_8]
MNEVRLNEIKKLIDDKPVEESLLLLSEKFKDKIVFSTSLSLEDQVITDIIYSNDLPIRIFTIDTGRLFNETYSVLNKTNEFYDKKIQIYFPKNDSVENLVNEKGPFSFYGSVENRKECCFIRKVEPLNRALAGMQAWITGIRAEHSVTRQEMNKIEWDEIHRVFKFHPLLDWSTQKVKDYIKKHNVPYNLLHDKGFVSIGCSPCTRAVIEGEDFRAGRWWWEDNTKKECGLHAG